MLQHEDSQQSQGSTLTLMEENRQEVIYFAYGSNLSTTQMLQRCPSSTPIGLGYLPDWSWFINTNGFASIVPDKSTGAGVYGLLYLLPPRDEDSLDGYEGVPVDYQKFKLSMEWVRDDQGKELTGQTVTALVYIDGNRVEEGPPRDEYVHRMERGIRDATECWGMSEEYAEGLRRKLYFGGREVPN